jgi:predicted outer membrane repeat protein
MILRPVVGSDQSAVRLHQAMSPKTVAALVLSFFGSTTALGRIIYVTTSGAGVQDGSSWTNAYAGVQAALAGAVSGDEIWVAAGTYHPAPPPAAQGQGRQESFALRSGVALYGGFVGNESARTQRDWVANPTILSGDLLDNDGPDWTNRIDNSIHVITATNVNDCTVDGFTVRGGHADGPGFGANPASEDQGSGANIYFSTTHFENVIFERNWASNHGAFNDHGDSVLVQCTFRNNFAQILGAGLYMHTNSDTRAIVCTFTGNTTPEDGGGAYSRSQVGGRVTDSVFTANTANNGAGMYNSDGSISAISNCTFTSNLALLGGGGVYAHFASPTVTNCSFNLNRAAESINEGGGGGGGSGGAGFWATGGNPTVSNCTFTDNIASFGGGAYFNENSTGTVQSCTFTNNRANEAGGLYALGSPVTVRQCTFTNNLASGGTFPVGGGFSSYFSDSIIDGCLFTGNRAYLGGGGIYCEGSAPQVLNSVFLANSTIGHEEGWGGGILNGFHTAAIELNLLLVGNTGDRAGGIANAIFSNSLIANCTLSENTSLRDDATGGAIHNFDQSAPTIANVISWNNHPAELSGDLSSVQFSCVKDAVGLPDQGNISVDPRFVIPPGPGPDGVWGTDDDVPGDLRLAPGSPCIDAGSNAATPDSLLTDLADNPRRADDPSIPDSGDGRGAIIDMGAYEFQGASCSPDFNGDGDSGTDADIEAFFACLAGSCCPSCASADFNHDGDTGTDADIESFFRVLAGGPC